MSLIDVPDAFPQMIMAVVRAVKQRKEATLDEIVAAIVPDTLYTPEEVAKSRVRPRSAVRVACAVGMLVDMGDCFEVAEPWRAAAGLETSPDGFAAMLASQLGAHAPAGLQDLARAAAWVLLQPPFGQRLDVNTMGLLLRRFPDGRAPAQPTKEQLGPMATWLEFAGLARRWSWGSTWALVPDPTRLVDRLVRADLAVGDATDAVALMQRWTTRYAVLPGGAVSNAVAVEVGLSPWELKGELPGAWALAFCRLEQAGVIRLAHAADARDVFHLTDFTARGAAKRFERIVRVA